MKDPRESGDFLYSVEHYVISKKNCILALSDKIMLYINGVRQKNCR
jgi:hypothetical protein